ncbi:MAG: hypothetical protein AAGU11_21255 [Syntrophobacteraceae bacterium]
MLKILILTALPYEYAYFRKITPHWRTESKSPFKTFTFDLPDKEIRIIEMGMGADCASEAFHCAIGAKRPDIVVSAGFSGGLNGGLTVGDVCIIRSVAEAGSGGQIGEKLFGFALPPALEKFCSEKSIRTAAAIAVSSPPEKRVLARLADDGPAMVDMETGEVAEIAFREQLPLICFRSISDGLEDELGFDLSDIAGPDGRIKLLGVLGTIVREPAVIAAFYRSWRRSLIAGRALGFVLKEFLSLPAGEIRSMQTRPISDQ